MGAFAKAIIPQPNIKTLRAKLAYLLDSREQGSYSKEEIDECYEALEKYWNTKTEKKRLDFPDWKTLKPEVIAILLEDMLTNGTYQTEVFLGDRDGVLNQKANKNDLVEYNYGGVQHTLTQLEERIIREYILKVVAGKCGLTSQGIKIDDLINEFNKSTKGGSSNATTYLFLAHRIEQIFALIDQLDDQKALQDICRDSITFLRDLIMLDTIEKHNKSQRMLLLQNPSTLQERLNFLAYLNTDYANEKNGDAARVQFDSPRHLTKFLLMRDDEFFKEFYSEICGVMEHKKYRNSQLMKNVSYGKMQEAIANDNSIMRGFLDLESDGATSIIYSDLEFAGAFNTGEPFYSQFIKNNNERFANTDKRIREEAEKQLIELFMKNEFGNASKEDASILDALSETTLTSLNKNALIQADYQIVDLPANESTNTGGSSGGGNPNNQPHPQGDRIIYNYKEDPVVSKYLKDVLDDEIKFEGVFATNVGTKVPGRSHVYYYVFSPSEDSEVKIIEPIGQKNNRTIIMRTKLGFEDFCKQLSARKKCLDDFVRSGEAIRLNHIGDDVETVNCPNRLRLIVKAILSVGKCKNMAELRNALRNQNAGREAISLDELAAFVTKEINISDLDEAKKYIVSIFKATDGIPGITLPRLQKLVTDVSSLRDFTGTSSDGPTAER